MQIKKFAFKGYKCFRKETQFDNPLLVNLIIGKNNSGKSSFLDVINHIYGNGLLPKTVNLSFFFDVEDKDINFIGATYDPERKLNFYNYSVPALNKSELIGMKLRVNISGNNGGIDSSCQFYKSQNGYRYSISMPDSVSFFKRLRTDNCVFMKAERDVTSERKGEKAIVLSNGTGLTSSLNYHFSNINGSRDLIESILNELNQILKGEEEFLDLRVLEDGEKNTIYLKNEFGEISLNNMGSGIKTILLVLFHLISHEEKPKDTIFMFEEIENNLHPEIQRRLFDTIYKYAIKNNKRVFITSHSHVAINCFYGKENARIYHIEKDSEKSSIIETIDSDLSKSLILDDLGVKASDIFQSNGIVWVEGPSDRVYINKWLKLVAPELKEGVHFTFLLYGGRLLSHYSIEQENGMIDILLTNRNSAIVIDSDVKEEGGTINSTKQRIVDGFKNQQKYCWVTKGREIENYIHFSAVNDKYRKESESKYQQIGLFEDFKDYIAQDDPNFESHKVMVAEQLVFEKESLVVLDLRERITELAESIKKWNN